MKQGSASEFGIVECSLIAYQTTIEEVVVTRE